MRDLCSRPWWTQTPEWPKKGLWFRWARARVRAASCCATHIGLDGPSFCAATTHHHQWHQRPAGRLPCALEYRNASVLPPTRTTNDTHAQPFFSVWVRVGILCECVVLCDCVWCAYVFYPFIESLCCWCVWQVHMSRTARCRRQRQRTMCWKGSMGTCISRYTTPHRKSTEKQPSHTEYNVRVCEQVHNDNMVSIVVALLLNMKNWLFYYYASACVLLFIRVGFVWVVARAGMGDNGIELE